MLQDSRSGNVPELPMQAIACPQKSMRLPPMQTAVHSQPPHPAKNDLLAPLQLWPRGKRSPSDSGEEEGEERERAAQGGGT
jgi:hypothetical protein